MKCVYEANDSIEAHMVLHLIEQAGLYGRVDGEYLQGGVGELQANGLVRVMVNDEHHLEAREVVKAWEAQTVEPTQHQSGHYLGKLGAGVIGFILGALVTMLIFGRLTVPGGI